MSDDPTPAPSTPSVALILAITGLVSATSLLISALTPVGQMIAKLFHHQTVIIPGPDLQRPPFVSAMGAAVGVDVNACKSKAADLLNSRGTSIRNGPEWVAGNDSGTTVMVLCNTATLKELVIAINPDEGVAYEKAIFYKDQIFPH